MKRIRGIGVSENELTRSKNDYQHGTPEDKSHRYLFDIRTTMFEPIGGRIQTGTKPPERARPGYATVNENTTNFLLVGKADVITKPIWSQIGRILSSPRN